MKIRVIRRPDAAPDVSTDLYRPGHIYDVSASLAEYLVAEGFAAVEMRCGSDHRPFTGHERRKFREVIDEHRNGRKVRH
jgi:hypothetical protein